MSSPTQRMPGSALASDDVGRICAEIFLELTGYDDRADVSSRSESELLATPMESFGLDSLSTMEFIMAVENRFDVSLDENEVNRCATIGELAGLVTKVMDV